MNEEQDTNHPWDAVDLAITKVLKALPWVALGMLFTAVLVFTGRNF
jgi:hypothetical protein